MGNDIDVHLGKRLRRRRRLLGLTQQQLAETVGVRFQQIQKYECGANRISAARLWQLAEALEQALASLPLKKRQAYVWHRLEGYSQPEIAQRMGLALNTVERYIMDATREMREQLERFCPD